MRVYALIYRSIYSYFMQHSSTSKTRSIGSCHCMALRRAARRISEMYDDALSATGLRATQFAILATLNASDGISVNELADQLDLDRTTTGKNLRPLEREGLIAIVVSAKDRRSRVIALTPAGRKRVGEAFPLWAQAQKSFEDANGRRKSRNLRSELSELRIDSKQLQPA